MSVVNNYYFKIIFKEDDYKLQKSTQSVNSTSNPIKNKRISSYTTDDSFYNYDRVSFRLDSPIKNASNETYEGYVQASQKLQKLRELQRRRDYTERYYSHEIRKLIGNEKDTEGKSLPVSPSYNIGGRSHEKQYFNANYYNADRSAHPKVTEVS